MSVGGAHRRPPSRLVLGTVGLLVLLAALTTFVALGWSAWLDADEDLSELLHGWGQGTVGQALGHAGTWLGAKHTVTLEACGLVPLALLLRRWQGALLLVLARLATPTLTGLLKRAVDRPRPAYPGVARLADPSFPSGHSALAAAFYAAVGLALLPALPRRLRAPGAAGLAAVVLLVMTGRVLLGEHFVTDVLAGALCGLLVVVLGGQLLRGPAGSGWGRRGSHPGCPPAPARSVPAADAPAGSSSSAPTSRSTDVPPQRASPHPSTARSRD